MDSRELRMSHLPSEAELRALRLELAIQFQLQQSPDPFPNLSKDVKASPEKALFEAACVHYNRIGSGSGDDTSDESLKQIEANEALSGSLEQRHAVGHGSIWVELSTASAAQHFVRLHMGLELRTGDGVPW
ncbi:unnamed protein product [Calypogeia fissa]